MKIMIDVPEELYKVISEDEYGVHQGRIYEIIRNGTPISEGYWIKTPKAVMGEGYMWYCNKCEHQVYQDSSRPYPDEKYCPNCGAYMKAESEDKK